MCTKYARTGRVHRDCDDYNGEVVAHIKACCLRLLLEHGLPLEAMDEFRSLAWVNLKGRILLAVPLSVVQIATIDQSCIDALPRLSWFSFATLN